MKYLIRYEIPKDANCFLVVHAISKDAAIELAERKLANKLFGQNFEIHSCVPHTNKGEI